MRKQPLGIVVLLSWLFSIAAFAQEQQWPPLPHFAIKENYTKREAMATKDYIEYVKFLRRTPQWPERFPTNYIEGKAFEALDTSQVVGTCALASYASDGKDEYSIFSLKKIERGKVSEVFYESKGDLFHTPHISPDGNTLILHEGFPSDDHGVGVILVAWDLKKGELWFPSWYYGGAGDIMFPRVLWSPGGRYLSYLRGGDTFGGSSDALGRPYKPPYTLYVCDLTTRQNYSVLQDAGLSWSWTYRGQLLFSHIPQEQFDAVGLRQVRPSIYVADASSGEPKKLFDGGYYAHESPNGDWVAFCDWPGKLLEAENVAKELQDNSRKGLFLFYKPTGKRVFVGDLQLPTREAPSMQWSPDGKNLYVLERRLTDTGVSGSIYKIAVAQTPDAQPSLSELTKIEIKPQPIGAGGFASRGISPDGHTLYLSVNEGVTEPKNSVRSTLIAVDAQTGKQTPIARLTNVNNENPGWDWHDDSGVNPAFAAAQKIEDALPIMREGEKDVDPVMNQPAKALVVP